VQSGHAVGDDDRRRGKSRASGNRSAQGRAWRRSRPYILGSSSIILAVGIWQLVVSAKLLNSAFLPAPLDVLRSLGDLVRSGDMWHDMAVSGQEFGIGLAISVVAGTVLGILTGWYKPLDEFLKPGIVILNGIPHVALIPILILIYGIGVTSKVVVVILSCLTVMIMNVATGVENVDPQLTRMASSFCAPDRKMLLTVVAPSVIPYFMSGLRISIGRAVVGVVVGEIFAARAGLGHRLILASDSFNMPEMYATLVILAVLAIVLTQGTAVIERRMSKWRS
jgi:NitT/TauT family transport system permease protein